MAQRIRVALVFGFALLAARRGIFFFCPKK
jgi:hypothetical protein